MRIIPWVGAAMMLCAAIPAGAANNTLDGGTGLVVMRTADTLPRGRLDMSAFVWGQAGRDAQDNLDWDALAMPQVNYGVFNNLEIGLGARYLNNIDSSASDLQFVRSQLKLRFLNLRHQGMSAAVTAYGGLLPSNHTDVASGANNYGAELEISMPRLLKPLGIFHLSLGFEKSDTKLATVPISYQRQVKKRVNMGVDVPLGKQWNASMEVLYTRAENLNDTLTLVPGLRYAASDKLTLLVAAGWGTPKNLARPQVRVLAGVSYVLGAASRTASPPAGNNSAVPADDKGSQATQGNAAAQPSAPPTGE